MLISISYIIILAFSLGYLFSKLRLPALLGMILCGIILGPSVLNQIPLEIIALLKEFKTVALIIILIRAGLGINNTTLKTIGTSSIKLSVIPCLFEGFFILFTAHYILGFTWIEGGILGFIIAAVSLAVVVPKMIDLKEKRWGNKNETPTLILTGASVDNIVAITLFGVFISLALGDAVSYLNLFWKLPLGIAVGILLGLVIGYLLLQVFIRLNLRDTIKTMLFILVAILFFEFTESTRIKSILPIAGLLGIMSAGYFLLEKAPLLASKIASKFNKLWVLSEILLFVYIGTQVKISTINYSVLTAGLGIILLGLTARSIGVWIALLKSNLNRKEKLFCIISFSPKATLQAAIGAVPLALIEEHKLTSIRPETAETMLSIAVLSILVTASLGAILIQYWATKLLKQE